MGATARQVAAGATIHVHSERFGTYEVPEERLLTFPNGLVGFPDGHRFALLDASRPDSPFRYLICVDLPELGFVVCDPEVFWPGYAEALPRPSPDPIAHEIACQQERESGSDGGASEAVDCPSNRPEERSGRQGERGTRNEQNGGNRVDGDERHRRVADR